MNTLRKMNLLLTALLVSMGAHAQTSPGATGPAEYHVQGLRTFSPEHPHTLWYRQPISGQETPGWSTPFPSVTDSWEPA